jgi:uncharacterized membrane protein
LFLAAWLLLNTGMIPGLSLFDPYPFAFLSTGVGVEFILLTTFVLMNQKHQARRAEQWAHLHLQLSMLTEQEVTKNMQMLHRLCQHLRLQQPAEHHQEVKELARPTPVTALVEEIGKLWELGQVLAEEMDEAERPVEEAATTGESNHRAE